MMCSLLTCPRQIQCAIKRGTPTPADRHAVKMLRDDLWDKWQPEWRRLLEKQMQGKELSNGELVCTTATHITAIRSGTGSGSG